MAVKDFSNVLCPSCGMLGTLRKDGDFAVCQDHLCGHAFPITKSGAFLPDARKKPADPDTDDEAPPADVDPKKKSSSPKEKPKD